MIRSGCKVNLGLEITGRRPDGYHGLRTIFYPLDLPADELVFEKTAGKDLEILCEGAEIPASSNTLQRAWDAFGQYCRPKFGVRATLRKSIPTEAGLGGGSGDAAAFLLWLNEAHDYALGAECLGKAALQVGADVPFFLLAKPCLATGIGEILRPIRFMGQGLFVLLVCPAFGVGTAWAFSRHAELSGQNRHVENYLTNIFDKDKGNSLSNAALQKCLGEHGIQNDLEAAVFAHYPTLAQLKNQILREGAIAAGMSGSGSSIFGIFADEDAGKKARETMLKSHERVYLSAMRNYC